MTIYVCCLHLILYETVSKSCSEACEKNVVFIIFFFGQLECFVHFKDMYMYFGTQHLLSIELGVQGRVLSMLSMPPPINCVFRA